MAYKPKQKSEAVEQAKNRLSAMKEIDQAKGRIIDYGDEDKPCTAVTLEAEIAAVEGDMGKYNGLLDQADALKNKIEAAEKALLGRCSQVLSGGRSKFGPDSSEFEQLGGIRTSERARPVRKPATK